MQVRRRSEEVRAGRLGIYHDEREVPQEVGLGGVAGWGSACDVSLWGCMCCFVLCCVCRQGLA